MSEMSNNKESSAIDFATRLETFLNERAIIWNKQAVFEWMIKEHEADKQAYAKQQVKEAQVNYQKGVITLCGSTRFFDDFRLANLKLTCAGWAVLSIGIDTKSDQQLKESGFYPANEQELKTIHDRLDILHREGKIGRSEAIMVIDVDGYIGNSTRKEIEYAIQHGKKLYSYTKTTEFANPEPFILSQNQNKKEPSEK